MNNLFKPVTAMNVDELKTFIAEHREGAYTILDVRQHGEYEEEHIPGARLSPLPQLQDSIDQLDRDKPIIVYCAAGGRSRAGAQFLSGQGFGEVYNLDGGIQAWQGLKATGPKELNLSFMPADATIAETVALAYDMEKGLQTFFETMVEETEDRQLKDLFERLARIEEKHKSMLADLSAEIDPQQGDMGSLEAESGAGIMEGGFDIRLFMEENAAFLKSVRDVIDLAMMLETQALDLYLRYAQKSTNPKSREILFRIADEEKAHLKQLGRLLDKKLEQ